MDKTKVLHISYGGLDKGGVSAVIFSITENLLDQCDFDCVVFAKKGISEERFVKIGKLHRVNCYMPKSIVEKIVRPFRMYSEIKKICKKEHYDVIHCHNGAEEAYGLLAAKHAGIKVRIAHSHNTNSPKKNSSLKNLYQMLLVHSINKNATHKVACSKQAAIDFFGTSETLVIPNCIALERFYCDRGGEDNLLRFVHVGRYDFQKNQEFILDVFDIIHKRKPKSTLRLVGFGVDKDKLESKVAMLGCENAVTFVPGDVDVATEYRQSDYMIFPSRYEGFGIALIEAQAAGVYCFVSEAVQPEANAGYMQQLSLSDSAEIWADAILTYHNENPQKAENRRERYNKYNAEAVSGRYGKLYESNKKQII